MQQSNRPGAFSFGNSRDGWISERCLCTGWTWGQSIDTRLTFQTTSTTSYLWKLTFGHTKTNPNSKNKVMNIRHENAPTLMQLKKQLLRHDHVFLMLHIYIYIDLSMYIYWNLFIHYGHVSTSVLLMVIHTCVIFFLTQAPLGVGPGVPCRHLVGSGKKTCVAQTWRQVQYKTTVGFGWFESNMSNSMASLNYGNHDSWSKK